MIFLLSPAIANTPGFNKGSDPMNYDDLVTSDPGICGGQPVIRGTRVPLRTVLGSVADGDSVEEIVRSFPSLTEELVRAVISFAAASAYDDLPAPGAKAPV